MIFIPGNCPSLKNSKVNKIYRPKTVVKYLRALNIQDYSVTKRNVKGYVSKDRPNLFIKYVGSYFKNIEYPAVIGLHFIRGTKHLFDFNNATHIIADLLSAHHFIEDDNMNYVTFVPFRINGKDYSIDKQSPGTWIRIFQDEWDLYDVKMPKLQEHK
jgi:hypothetical protein